MIQEASIPTPNLHRLHILNTQLTTIRSDTFENLHSLEKLQITGNSKLLHVQPNAFRGLYSVTKLVLGENHKLKTLYDNTFVSLDELIELDLHYNSIEVLEDNVFAPLDKVEEINLVLNQLTYIQEKLFYYNHKLKRVNLEYNKLSRVDKILTKLLPVRNTPGTVIEFDMEELKLNNNKKIEINPEAFDYMRLKSLLMNEIDLDHINRRWFLTGQTIEHLEFSGNKLTEIAIDSFDQLPSLRFLNLAYNKIRNLAKGCFHAQNQLVSLKLNNNELTVVSEELFSRLVMLEELLLADNKIGLVHPEIFKTLKNLKTLTLNNNRIVGLQKGLFDSLRNLRTLTIYNNRISFIDSNTFSSLIGITELFLSHNDFQDIETETFNLEHFGKNKHIISSRLTTVDLSYNKLKELKAYSFIPLVKVTILHLANNMISKIENGTFEKTTKLQELKLRENQLEFLPRGIFDSLKELSQLDLTHNKLSNFPEKVFNLPLLENLYLNFNRIQSVSENALAGTNIVELSLFGNLLTYLPRNFFTNAKQLRRVVLEGNPYQCVCYEGIVKLLESLHIKRDRFIPYYQDPRVGMWSFRAGLVPVCIVTNSNQCLENNTIITPKLLKRFNDAFVGSSEVCNESYYCYKNSIVQ